MSDTMDWLSSSDSPMSKFRQKSMTNIENHASDGRHTETLQAPRDPVNDYDRFKGAQISSISTTGKESDSKATTEPEKPSENLINKVASFFSSLKEDWWYFELGACLISALAMTVLIIVIGRHNGKPLPKWPMHITVSTFIAVCSNITRQTLLVPVVCAFRSLSFPFCAVS